VPKVTRGVKLNPARPVVASLMALRCPAMTDPGGFWKPLIVHPGSKGWLVNASEGLGTPLVPSVTLFM
jgi:hypothetical protein